MFNNPFNSFHDTIAEAKEEREQLDRLLTISTPRERLLVAVIALFLLVLTTWLFFGNVTRTFAIEGVLVEAGENSPGGKPSLQALVWVGKHVAPHIEAGMPVTLELRAVDGQAGAIAGVVAQIAPVPVSGTSAALEAAVSMSVHRVDIVLDDSVERTALAGRECRIIVELGSQSPAAFLRMRRS